MFPINFAGAYGYAGVTATVTSALTVKKNGTTVGTITFTAATAAATFVTTGGTTVSYVAGDRLEIIAPATQDATLANISLTIPGYR
jgi:hypothetical protein